MGLIQNIASLANPTANAIRPTDILMAGQQAQQQIQAGLTGIGNIMKESRTSSAQQRADMAVADLLSNSPTGLQDPTQFNQMLGMASAYGSQGMKDTAKAAIDSSREGYRNAVAQEHFNKTFEQREAENTEKIRQFDEKLNADKEQNKEILELEKKKLNIQELQNKGILSIQQAQLGISKLTAEQNILSNKLVHGLKLAELYNKGYTYDPKTGSVTYNENSPKALNAHAQTLLGDFSKTYSGDGLLKTAQAIGSMNSGWNPFGNMWTTEKGQQLEVVSRANQIGQIVPLAVQQLLGKKGTTARDLESIKGSAESFIRDGTIDSKSVLGKLLYEKK